MKKTAIILLLIVLGVFVLTACGDNGVNGDAPPLTIVISGNNNGDAGNVSTPKEDKPNESNKSDYVFDENDEDVIIMFNFEDEEHERIVTEWLRTVLFAEDYFEFVDGEDFNAPIEIDEDYMMEMFLNVLEEVRQGLEKNR